MSRYRRVSICLWGDEKFRRLSPLPPSGQSLWLYLLLGPEGTGFPGLIRAGEAQLAETLGWPLDAFRDAFAEAIREGIVKASWPDRLIWLPRALAHNPPQSINTLKYWAKVYREIPECELKVFAGQALKAYMDAMPKGFKDAFRDAFKDAIRDSVTVEVEVEVEVTGDGKPPALVPAAEGALGPGDELQARNRESAVKSRKEYMAAKGAKSAALAKGGPHA